MSSTAVCYRCDQPGRFRLSWLAYTRGGMRHDNSCLAHATVSRDWAIITRSSEALRW